MCKINLHENTCYEEKLYPVVEFFQPSLVSNVQCAPRSFSPLAELIRACPTFPVTLDCLQAFFTHCLLPFSFVPLQFFNGFLFANFSSLTDMIFVAGILLCGPIWGGVADRKGRKFAMQVTLFCDSVVGILSAISPNYVTLVILRFLSGCM